MVEHVSDGSFAADVLNSDTPVLVDFWAEWCGPCKMIAPVLDQIAGEYGNKIRVVKMNVDQNTETPAKYSVRGIPCLMLFSGGKVIATKVGAVSKTELAKFIDDAL
jgi:thioredoxin 1